VKSVKIRLGRTHAAVSLAAHCRSWGLNFSALRGGVTASLKVSISRVFAGSRKSVKPRSFRCMEGNVGQDIL
jgi:hypothetical protein